MLSMAYDHDEEAISKINSQNIRQLSIDIIDIFMRIFIGLNFITFFFLVEFKLVAASVILSKQQIVSMHKNVKSNGQKKTQ